jgi:hypothetical protein
MQDRKEKDALTRGRFIELEPSMLSLIQNSQHISKGKSVYRPLILFSNTG